jgi:hypothetical protein
MAMEEVCGEARQHRRAVVKGPLISTVAYPECVAMYKPGMSVSVTTITGAVSVRLLSRLGPCDWLALDVNDCPWFISLDTAGWKRA